MDWKVLRKSILKIRRFDKESELRVVWVHHCLAIIKNHSSLVSELCGTITWISYISRGSWSEIPRSGRKGSISSCQGPWRNALECCPYSSLLHIQRSKSKMSRSKGSSNHYSNIQLSVRQEAMLVLSKIFTIVYNGWTKSKDVALLKKFQWIPGTILELLYNTEEDKYSIYLVAHIQKHRRESYLWSPFHEHRWWWN
jgi:hypothetical protein